MSICTQANLQDQTESPLDLTRSPAAVMTVPAEDFFLSLLVSWRKPLYLDYSQYNDFILDRALATTATTMNQIINRKMSGNSMKTHGAASV